MDRLLLVIPVAVFPIILLLIVFLRRSRLKPEGRALIGKLFLAGFLASIPAIFLEILLAPLIGLIPPSASLSARALLGIALPEEGMKFIALLLVLRRQKQFDDVMDRVVYAMTVATGFALFENLLYVFTADEALTMALVRGFTSVLLHVLSGAVMGLSLKRPGIEGRIGWMGAVLVHGLYNFILMEPRLPIWLVFPFLILTLLILGLIILHSRRNESKTHPDFSID